VIEEIKEIESTFIYKLGEHVKTQTKFISILDYQANQDWFQNEFEELKAACLISNELIYKTNRKFDELIMGQNDESVPNVSFSKYIFTEHKVKWGSSLELISGRAFLDAISDDIIVDI